MILRVTGDYVSVLRCVSSVNVPSMGPRDVILSVDLRAPIERCAWILSACGASLSRPSGVLTRKVEKKYGLFHQLACGMCQDVHMRTVHGILGLE